MPAKTERHIVGVATLCSDCNIEKDDSLFAWKHGVRDGRICLECRATRSAEYRLKHPKEKHPKEILPGTFYSRRMEKDPNFARDKGRRFRARRPEYGMEYYFANREKLLDGSKKCYINHKEERRVSSRRYAKENPEKVAAASTKWLNANEEYVKQRSAIYRQENKALYTFHSNIRRCALINRTPIWSELDKIRLFYENRPEGMVVDHVIPLQGKTVSGLHVIGNLQYLTVAQNRHKKNKYPYVIQQIA